MICSKIDHGSFMYGSTMNSKLSVTGLVQNTGICLDTGTVCTSRVDSLYVESRELPLSEEESSPTFICGKADNSA
jgi:hypothetical protein